MKTISDGDSGPEVERVQLVLALPVTGDFDDLTETQVKAFQAAAGLAADGVVGPASWDAIVDLETRMAAGDSGLPAATEDKIVTAAAASSLIDYDWDDRGRAPAGYIKGMALAYGLAVLQWQDDSAITNELAVAEDGDEETDALAWYADEFADRGMDNSEDGLDTLRHLFVLLIGLGMRESSGVYYEGRDMSADNVAADTAEAGLFQASWNLKSCSSSLMADLMHVYWNDPKAWWHIFSAGLTPEDGDLSHYGSGEGAKYQFLAKYSPAFAVYVAALGLRKRRQHWGPINRREVEIRPEADELLQEVENIVSAPVKPNKPPKPDKPNKPAKPEDRPPAALHTLDIVVSKGVVLTINGRVVQG